jgi:hypothetical protein
MTNVLLSFRRGALVAGLPTVLAILSLSVAAQTPARSAFDLLEVGRWSSPPGPFASWIDRQTNGADALCEWCLRREFAYWLAYRWPDAVCCYI